MDLTITDPVWRDAIAALDRGDLSALEAMLAAHPRLVRERLDVGEGYFTRPYLLWFIAENPVRNDRLPPNIVEVARMLVDAARAAGVLGEQLDYVLQLVATGRVVREAGVQRALIDLFAGAGADLDAALRGALPHRELDAARHLRDRGARLTLIAAAALGSADDVRRLGCDEPAAERQNALMVAACAGRADTIAALLELGVDVNAYGAPGFHAHATPLHQAVATGVLAAVERLVEGGADPTLRDRGFDSTALGWAEHVGHADIAAYLRARSPSGRSSGPAS